MQRAIALLSIAAVLLCSVAAFAANPDSETAQYGGHLYVNVQTGESVFFGPNEAPAAGVNVYTNISSPANAGISSTSLASVWGDHVLTTGLGIVSQHDLTIYNGSTTAGQTLTACTVAINFYDFASSLLIGGYTGNLTFTPALSPGFYSIVTFINLETLVTPITLATTDLVVTQQMTSKTGTATRFGVASLDPVTLGSSPVTMYINSPTIGPAGYYQLTVSGTPINTNPGYRINVIAPVATEPTTWGKVKSLYR